VPAVPFPAEITTARTVTPQALVAFRGNSYSVPPGLRGATVTVMHRLGSAEVAIATASGAVIARHRAPRIACDAQQRPGVTGQEAPARHP
jgi:hypothetical protein